MIRTPKSTLSLFLLMAALLLAFAAPAMAYTTVYTINDTGGDCSAIGTWNGATKTCTLTGDISVADSTDTLILMTGTDITLDGAGYTVEAFGNIYRGIVLQQSTGCTVIDMRLSLDSGYGDAILLDNTDSSTVQNVTISFLDSLWSGIYLLHSDSNTIRDVNFEGGWYGTSGILLEFSNSNTIDNNYMFLYGNGVWLYESAYNIISNNTIVTPGSSQFFSINLDMYSHHNEILLNSFINSPVGILVYDDLTATDNKVYNNEFINSYPASDFSGQNAYQEPLPVGGNYYDFYDTPAEGCNDANSDGFCDDPYIDEYSYMTDLYPWVGPTFVTDLDKDGYRDTLDCNDNDYSINPTADEVPYNGIDENCNGMADDTDFDRDGYDYTVDCNDNDYAINPGSSEIKHNGIDEDCNGYDLTIEITLADYNPGPDKLTVEATSDYGQSANLEVLGYGPMDWDKKNNIFTLTVRPAGGDPGTVTVSGPEGQETASTN